MPPTANQLEDRIKTLSASRTCCLVLLCVIFVFMCISDLVILYRFLPAAQQEAKTGARLLTGGVVASPQIAALSDFDEYLALTNSIVSLSLALVGTFSITIFTRRKTRDEMTLWYSSIFPLILAIIQLVFVIASSTVSVSFVSEAAEEIWKKSLGVRITMYVVIYTLQSSILAMSCLVLAYTEILRRILHQRAGLVTARQNSEPGGASLDNNPSTLDDEPQPGTSGISSRRPGGASLDNIPHASRDYEPQPGTSGISSRRPGGATSDNIPSTSRDYESLGNALSFINPVFSGNVD